MGRYMPLPGQCHPEGAVASSGSRGYERISDESASVKNPIKLGLRQATSHAPNRVLW